MTGTNIGSSVGVGNASPTNASIYGSRADQTEDFENITFQQSQEKYPQYMHAAHAFIYAHIKEEDVLWDKTKKNAAILVGPKLI